MNMIDFRLEMENVYSGACTFMDTLLALPSYSPERERFTLLCTDPNCLNVTLSKYKTGRCRNCGSVAVSKDFFEETGLGSLPGYLFDNLWSSEDNYDFEHNEVVRNRAERLAKLDDMRSALAESFGNNPTPVMIPGTYYLGFEVQGASLSAPKRHFIKARSNKDVISTYVGSGNLYVPNVENAPIYLLPTGVMNLNENLMSQFLEMISRLRAGEALNERHYDMLREEYRGEHWEETGRKGFLKALIDRGFYTESESLFLQDDAKCEFLDVLYSRAAAGNGIVPSIKKNGVVDFKYDKVLNAIDWTKARKRWTKLCGECNPFPFTVQAD